MGQPEIAPCRVIDSVVGRLMRLSSISGGIGAAADSGSGAGVCGEGGRLCTTEWRSDDRQRRPRERNTRDLGMGVVDTGAHRIRPVCGKWQSPCPAHDSGPAPEFRDIQRLDIRSLSVSVKGYGSCNVAASRCPSERAPGGQPAAAASDGWRRPSGTVSLPEVHGTVPIPLTGGFWRKMFAFAGPGYLVAVGYMDPGNWATDLAGGSRYGYTLLSVIMLSNLMAILLQALAARLGIASGRDLAQACRDQYSRPIDARRCGCSASWRSQPATWRRSSARQSR